MNKARTARAEKGLCPTCGNPTAEGKRKCEDHLRIDREYAAKYYAIKTGKMRRIDKENSDWF